MKRSSTARRALQAGALFVFSLLLAVAGAAAAATVAQVIDGDSVILADGREVRLIGVNAPEFGRTCPEEPSGARNSGRAAGECITTSDQPLAKAARDRLTTLVENQQVTVVVGQEQTDRYGRTLAHLYLSDGTSVEEILLREGMAWLVAIPPNVERLAQLQAAEGEARRKRLGVWAIEAYAPRAAKQLRTDDSGFQRVSGTITRVGQSAHAVYFDLGPTFTIVIPRADWETWFKGDPRTWRGRHVIATGWVSARSAQLRMRIRHPAMLTSERTI